MINTVIDTNVLVSSLITPYGKAAEILNLVTNGQIQVYYGASILAEYAEVLSRPRFNFSSRDQEGVISGIRRFGIFVNAPVSIQPLPDESDRVFYDTALFSGAFLITGNLKHYPREDFIISPAEFLLLNN